MRNSYGPDTVSLMCRVCDSVYRELNDLPGATRAICRDIASRVIAAVGAGGRDAPLGGLI
jgi:hypothetical protein